MNITIKHLTLAVLGTVVCAFGQTRAQRVRMVAIDPTGSCGGSYFTVNISTGNIRVCSGGTWVDGGSGGGTSAVGSVYTTVTYSATPTYTVSASAVQSFAITLTGNITSSTLDTANATQGQHIIWRYCQDATGGRTVVWPTNVTGYGSVDTTASACSSQSFIWDGTNATADSGMVSDTGVAALVTSSGVLTLPTGNQTMVGRTTTDTFQNKTISGANNTLTIREADLSISDNTTANTSASAHGFAPKLPNDSTKFLNGAGAWTTPTTGGGSANASGSPWWILGPATNGGGLTVGSSGSANRGVRYGFTLPTQIESRSIAYSISTAAGTSKGFQAAIYNWSMTAAQCMTAVATSGGTPDINATGAAKFLWSTGAAVSGGVCTLPAGSYWVVVTTDSTTMQMAIIGTSPIALINATTTTNSATGTLLGAATSALSTGTGGSLAFTADLSGATWAGTSSHGFECALLQ